ncbi:hypothetical protein DF034_18495 [Burkholderia anthina]|uniref:hypothetical protein n=1 Tax=Burkholderia anthina TaxID=179879 RepID=UPI000F5FDDD7|nr:hypothetical protein [Burkholderia anthina]RQX81471.1 hypothetical protein DF034_18495 [Burkholderia anthina]
MLRKLMASGPLLSRRLVDAIAACVALLYLAVYANARALLPEFIFRDADKIDTQISGGATYDGTSFDAVGRFYRALGGAGTSVFVAALGVLFIWLALRQTRRAGSLFANLVLIAPCLFFNLFVASKDTLVVLIAVLVALAARRFGTVRTLAIAVVLYAGYAALIRSYFALIVLCAGSAWALRRAPLPLKVVALLLAGAAFVALPDSVYTLLQHPRDVAVDYLVYESPFGARTSFYNPYPPDSFLHFVGNYAYSVARLNLPILFSFDVKGIAMQGFIALVLASAWPRVAPSADTRAASLPGGDTLACLILAHVAVSMLFEPDLGSYTRHLSSVALFAAVLWPWRTARAAAPAAPPAASVGPA